MKKELGQLITQYRAVEYLKNRKTAVIDELRKKIREEEDLLRILKATQKSLVTAIKKKDPSFSHE